MAEIHVLNVGQGDCIIFKSNSGRITMFDICGGNISDQEDRTSLTLMEKAAVRGNYQMCKHPTNPIRFLTDKMGESSVFRFILSHPDMDHMDGFNNFMNKVTVMNFWDSGVRKDKPDFSQGTYKEEDWDRYVSVRDEKESVTVVTPKAGSKGKYYNKDDKDGGGDYISIYAPDQELVDDANNSDNEDLINDASYVIVYRSAGGRILLPGDAHDNTWNCVLGDDEDYDGPLKDCEFMVAPHHGRDSNRSWEFLDKINPKFSVLGCASSKHLAYNAWNSRNLEKITQNQAGNIAVYPNSSGLDIYVENEKFASAFGGNTSRTDNYRNFYLKTVEKEK